MKYILVISILFVYCISNGQSIDDYFEIASAQNPGLQAKYKNFEAALEKVSQVNSLPDPNFAFGYFISPVETRVGPQKAKFSLTQILPWFGTLQAQEDVSSILAEAKYQEFLDARNKLYYQVSAAYYPLYELQRWQDIERENIQILETYKTIATKKFENNQSSMVDVLRVDIMLKDATTNLIILEKQQKPLQIRFNNILNRPALEPIFVEYTLIMPQISMEYRKDSLLISNPMLDEIDLKIKASESSEYAINRQSLPKIGLGLDYVIVGKRTDMTMEDNGKDVLMPMVSASIPIFRKKYKSAQKEAQLMQESYAFQKIELANQLTSSYEMAWFGIQKQQELIKLYDAQIMESEQSLNLLFSAYGNSGKEFEEVLRMQQQLLKYEKMKATALAAFQIALAELDYLTAKTR